MGIFDKFKKYNQDPKQNIPQEVYGTPDTMNGKDGNYDDGILFYFSKKPSFGKRGDDGGHSTTIYIDGKVLREKYEFGNSKSVSQETIILSDDDIIKILTIIDKFSDEIESYPEKMYSCCDGDMYKFVFGTKTIEGDSGIGEKHHLFAIVQQIMHVVTASKRRYNMNPFDNMPRMVYAPPDVMRSMQEEKYDVKPEKNVPQKVYGIPKPKRDEEK
jgi:hypothetical protein